MKILFKGIVLGNLIALNLIVFFAYRAVSGKFNLQKVSLLCNLKAG